MKSRTMMSTFGTLLLLGFLLSACAGMQPPSKPPTEISASGKTVWKGEYEFSPPPARWKLFWPDEGDEFVFGYMVIDPGKFPSQSLFVYDEEPFGASLNLEERASEFLKRYLWSAYLKFNVLEKKPSKVAGAEGLALIVEGTNTVRKEKARSKLVFTKRGDRVVALYLTQWRPIDGTYDLGAFDVFDQFVSSFSYLKKSFYETL
jgi:hypothetical protein